MKFRPLHVVIALVVAMIFCCALQLGCCPSSFREGLLAANSPPASSPPVQPSVYGLNNQRPEWGGTSGEQIAQQALEAITYGTSDMPSAPDSLPWSGPNVGAAQPSYSQMVTGPQGQQILATPHNTVMGIPQSQIPSGQDNLYVLKSEIVPPVCPACPSGSVCPREKPCPPCPACARCPEPAFECKKVPNYTTSRQAFPVPILNDFSTFGM